MAPPVTPNEILGGKFRVGKEIQRGGTSIVYEAHHVQLGQTVAVKILFTCTDASNGFESALLEAKAAARLTNEHAVRVMDIGVTSSGNAYLVMEKLDGHDVEHELREGPLSVAGAVWIVSQACVALAEAHALGMVHRDIKPSNVFLAKRPDGTRLVKVLDFGLAKTAGNPWASNEKRSGIAGSPGYASPEQLALLVEVDARADIWGLGALLYKLITGRKPFEVDTLEGTLVATLTTPIPRMTNPHEPVPPELEAIVRKCLQRERAHRFGSVRELVAALAPFCPAEDMAGWLRVAALALSPRDDGPTVRDPVLSVSDNEAGVDVVLTSVVAPPRRPLPFILSGFAGGLLVALLFIAWLTVPPATAAPAPSSAALPNAAPLASTSSTALTLLSPLPARPAPPPEMPSPSRRPRSSNSRLAK